MSKEKRKVVRTKIFLNSEIVTELLTPNTVRQDLALAIDDKITILTDKATRTNENILTQETVEKFRNVLDSYGN